MARKHWTDQPVHPTHTWQKDGHCEGCMAHMSWPIARDACSLRAPKAPRKARALDPDPEKEIAA